MKTQGQMCIVLTNNSRDLIFNAQDLAIPASAPCCVEAYKTNLYITAAKHTREIGIEKITT